jgi:hypothetical protein
MQVHINYLQVLECTHKETPAGDTHHHNLVSHHVGTVNINGDRQRRIKGASPNDDKGDERHTITMLRRIGRDIDTGALLAEITYPPTEK